MKKYVAAGAVALAVTAGAAFGVRQATNSAACAKPITILGSEQAESIKVLEAYISESIAPTFKDPQYLSWESDDYSPIILPDKISARIFVMNSVTGIGHYYHVTVTRDCQGGDWEVVEFKRLPK